MFTVPEPLLSFLVAFWRILKEWWWVLPLILLWRPFIFLYIWWRKERYDATVKRIILEIKIPKEVMKPIKAMEQVFAGFHAIHDVFTWREVWLEGQFLLTIALEIVSLGGEVHFYIRTPQQFRGIIESNIYSQYPEAEITEVPDYAKAIPQDIPNKDWEIWGTDEINTKPNPYPIRTYTYFETEIQPKEEKRVDPLASLLESLATLGPGEQLWVQVLAKPIRGEIDWINEGLGIRDKLVRRPGKPQRMSMIQEAATVLITGEVPGAPSTDEREFIPPEMKLTPGEREIVSAIENKISKFGYDCNLRYVYLAKRDVFFKPRARYPYGFFKEISSENMNGFKPNKYTMTKVKSVFFWFLDQRRLFLRKRRIFKRYVKRVPTYFPRGGGTFILNTEELATLFHFPGRIVAPAPSVPRVESKKGEAPPGLPVE